MSLHGLRVSRSQHQELMTSATIVRKVLTSFSISMTIRQTSRPVQMPRLTLTQSHGALVRCFTAVFRLTSTEDSVTTMLVLLSPVRLPRTCPTLSTVQESTVTSSHITFSIRLTLQQLPTVETAATTQRPVM